MRNKPKINNALCDGQKLYDTPYYTPGRPAVHAGYNNYVCGQDMAPTRGIGSASRFTAYWERYLYMVLLRGLEIKMPDTWDLDYTMWVGIRLGYVGIINPGKKYGVIPQHCTLAGINVFYRPTRIVLANPLLKDHIKWELGTNAALLRFTPDYSGVWDIIHYAAENLAELTQSYRMAAVNSRLADGYIAKNKAAADTLHLLFNCLDEGQPAYVLGNTFTAEDLKTGLPWAEIHNNVGSNYLVDRLQDALQAELVSIYKQLGLPVLSDKKERLLSSEVQLEASSAGTVLDVMIDSLNRSLDDVFKVFPELRGQLSFKKVVLPRMDQERKEGAADAESV